MVQKNNEIVPFGAEGRRETAPCEGIVLKENLLLYVNGELQCHLPYIHLPMKVRSQNSIPLFSYTLNELTAREPRHQLHVFFPQYNQC